MLAINTFLCDSLNLCWLTSTSHFQCLMSRTISAAKHLILKQETQISYKKVWVTETIVYQIRMMNNHYISSSKCAQRFPHGSSWNEMGISPRCQPIDHHNLHISKQAPVLPTRNDRQNREYIHENMCFLKEQLCLTIISLKDATVLAIFQVRFHGTDVLIHISCLYKKRKTNTWYLHSVVQYSDSNFRTFTACHPVAR